MAAKIVVTKQPNTSDEAYALAKRLQMELSGFINWFTEKEQILKDNGFHKLKG